MLDDEFSLILPDSVPLAHMSVKSDNVLLKSQSLSETIFSGDSGIVKRFCLIPVFAVNVVPRTRFRFGQSGCDDGITSSSESEELSLIYFIFDNLKKYFSTSQPDLYV